MSKKWPDRHWPIITSHDKRTNTWYWDSILRDGGKGGPFAIEGDALFEAKREASHE